MKKKSIDLGRKLFLNKETITGLGRDQRNEVKGGKLALTNGCTPPVDTVNCVTNNNNCATGCVCAPTIPTWGLKCGCNEAASMAFCPAGPVEAF